MDGPYFAPLNPKNQAGRALRKAIASTGSHCNRSFHNPVTTLT